MNSVTIHSLNAALAAFNVSSTVETRQDLLSALLGSELFFAAASRKSPSDPLRLAFMRDGRGRLLLPGFTDERSFAIFSPKGGDLVKASASTFIPAALEGRFEGIAINPRSRLTAVVTRRALELLTQGHPANKLSLDPTLIENDL